MRNVAIGLLLATSTVFASTANAALVDRGGGMIYDSTLNITWLADANYAQTSGYDADGLMTWTAANAWAASLEFGGFTDWRLPTLNPSDTSCSHNFEPGGGFDTQYFGFNCTGGELSHLLVADLGNKAGQSVLDTTGDTAEQIANLALFSNVQSDLYWSGTVYAPVPARSAWAFFTNVGVQDFPIQNGEFYAWAVRPGDVLAVPEPASALLIALGLAGLGAVRRRRFGA